MSLTRDDVVRWLNAEADSYTRDAHTAAASPDPALAGLSRQFREGAAVLRETARRFTEHGLEGVSGDV